MYFFCFEISCLYYPPWVCKWRLFISYQWSIMATYLFFFAHKIACNLYFLFAFIKTMIFWPKYRKGYQNLCFMFVKKTPNHMYFIFVLFANRALLVLATLCWLAHSGLLWHTSYHSTSWEQLMECKFFCVPVTIV